MTITRPHQAPRGRPYRAHALNAITGRPLCGGGFGSASEHTWQSDLADPNCERCQAILARRAQLALTPPRNQTITLTT